MLAVKRDDVQHLGDWAWVSALGEFFFFLHSMDCHTSFREWKNSIILYLVVAPLKIEEAYVSLQSVQLL